MDTDVVMPFRPEGTPGVTVTAEAEPDTTALTIDEVDRLLDEVEAALTRLDDGTYGVCGGCGAPIDETRLSERPTGLDCSSCVAGDSEPPPTVDAADPADAGVDPPAEPEPSPWSIREFPED